MTADSMFFFQNFSLSETGSVNVTRREHTKFNKEQIKCCNQITKRTSKKVRESLGFSVNAMHGWLHSGVVVSTGSTTGWGFSVWSLHVLPVYVGFSPGTPASSHRPKTCLLR